MAPTTLDHAYNDHVDRGNDSSEETQDTTSLYSQEKQCAEENEPLPEAEVNGECVHVKNRINEARSEEKHSAHSELAGDVTCTDDNIEVEKAPDGGWGWCIVLGTVLLRCIIGGLVRSRGILYLKFKDRFHSTATSTALLTSLNSVLRLAVGPFVSILTNRIDCRKLTALGAMVMSVSYIISAYTPNQEFLYFSFSVLGGFGRAFVLTPIPILLGSYFDKRRSLAFGLAAAGFSMGGFTLVPVIEILFQTYGFQGAFLILGGFAFQILVFATLFRPIELHRRLTRKSRPIGTNEDLLVNNVESLNFGHDATVVKENEVAKYKTCKEAAVHQQNDEHEQKEQLLENDPEQSQAKINSRRKSSATASDKKAKKKLLDLSILKDVRYLSYVLATMCFALPTPGLFLPALAKERGLTDMQAASLLAVSAGFDTVFKIISGFVLDFKMFRHIRPEIYNGVTFSLSFALALIPSARTYLHFFVLCAIQGAITGTKNAQGSVIVLDMLGVDKLASSMAVTMTVQGVAAFVGPTVSGWLTDVHGRYDGAYYFGSCAVFVGACVMAYGQIRRRWKDKAKRANIEKQQSKTEVVEKRHK